MWLRPKLSFPISDARFFTVLMSLVHASPADFVCVGIQSWDLPLGSNAKDMALELSKTNRVLYVNPPLDRITKLRNRGNWHPKGQRIPAGHMHRVSDTLWVLYPATTLESINWLPESPVFDRLNWLNNQRLARSIRQAIKYLNFGEFTIFNDSDVFRSFYLKELLQPDRYVYYTRDNLLGVDYWKKHGQRLEPALMRKADLVVSNSPYLARIADQYNPHSVYIGQGCDLSKFDPSITYPAPPDMAAIPQPRVGYIGALISMRLSLDWLESVARQRPQWNIVLVGPEDEQFKNSALHQLPNVHFLGAKSPDALPAYLQQLDVAINPQQLNKLTIGNYPRKIDEYLAMGKPVVALRTEAMSIFKGHVTLADTLDEFISGIGQALYSPLSATAGIAFVQSHTWANSAAALLDALNKLSVNTSQPATA